MGDKGDNKKYSTTNNTEAHYDMYMYLFSNWMRRNHKRFLEKYLKKEGCKAEITTKLMFLDLLESRSDQQYLILICKKTFFTDEIDIKNDGCYYPHDITNIKDLDLNKILVQENLTFIAVCTKA